MCSLSELADKVVDPCRDIVARKLLRPVNYIFQYDNNMKELEDEKKKLEKQMDENERKVETARTDGEIVEENVVEWAEMAENMKREVEEFIDAKAIYESVKCLKFSCPNSISRYQMSKQYDQKIRDLKRHIQAGNFDIVAHLAPPPPEPSSGDFVYFNSRAPLLKMIKDGLVTPTVNMIGVYGMEGVGKTAIVKEVGKQMREDGTFDEIVFAVVSQDVNIHDVQRQIAEGLTMKLQSETEEGRANALWNRLNNGKNNLVILDDLWRELDLKSIGIPLRDGNKGCKVIFTTRDRNVLRKMKVDKYVPVVGLYDNESWDLFKKKLDTTFISEELHPLAVSVCKECKGLPIAILSVGEELAGKEDIYYWTDALGQLQKSVDPNVYASLRLRNYNFGKEEISILLLCCLYPKDTDVPINFLVFHCIAKRLLDEDKNTVEKTRDQIFTLVNSLKTHFWLLDGKNEDFVKVDDGIRLAGVSYGEIVENYMVKHAINEWPYDYINDSLVTLSISFTKLREVPNDLACPQLHTVRIECMDSSFQFPDNIFNGVRELRILELKGICMLKSPSSLANLSKLRTLILIDCALEDMSFLKFLKGNLEVLVIASRDIKALPRELGELSHLRVLLLNESVRLKLIPAGVISNLTDLEELSMPNNFDFCEEPLRATLSELSSLTRLTSLSVFIPDVTQIPDLRFDNLVNYRLEVGSRFEGRYQHLRRRNLKLADTYNDKLCTLLDRAQVLHLKRVKGLENILLDRVGKGLFELERLVVEDCHDWEYLLGIPKKSNSFSKLSVVEVVGCSFKSLFTLSFARGLPKLQELEVRHCNLLEEIIKTEGKGTVHLNELNKLNLVCLPKLTSFGPKIKNITAEGDRQPLFNEKIAFPSLKYLVIEGCSSITEIWDKEVQPKNSFPQLVNVQVFECKKLANVFPSNMFTMAQNLKEISVGCCRGVEFVVSITGVEEANQTIIFHSLNNVTLIDLKNFKSFCGSSTTSERHYLFDPQVFFPELGYLFIQSLSNIMGIWEKQVLPTKSFPLLTIVRIYDCEKLVNVFPSNLWAKMMEKVRIGGCKGLKVVVSITGVEKSEASNNCLNNFPQLRELYLTNLENLITFLGDYTESKPQSLFDTQIQFPALSLLVLQNTPNLKTFMQQMSKGELQVNFPALKDMYIDDHKARTNSVLASGQFLAGT